MRDERASTKTWSFRCKRERCRLSRGVGLTVAQKSYGVVSMLLCHPEFISGSSHRDKEGSPLTPTLSCRARGKHAAFTLAEGATHVGICDNIGKSAFTLAEVLITLAIIGVVAVMTIPTLISDYQKQVTVTKLKVTYSTINQALRLSAIDNGPVSNWDRNILVKDVDWTYDETLDWFNKYLAPYLRYSKIEKFSNGTYVGANGEELPDDYLLVF